jgi:hypothetical protein
LFLALNELNAQNPVKGKKMTIDSNRYQGSYLKINTLSFYDFATPTIQISVERRISTRLGLETGIGIPLKIKKALKNTDSTYVRYYKFKNEVKFYSTKKPLRYFAFELFYNHISYSGHNVRFTRNHETKIAEYAEVKKLIYGFGLHPGFLSKSKKTGKITSDFSFALGIRIPHTIIKDENSVPYSPRSYEWFSLQPIEGWKITPHLAFAVKALFKL